MGEGVMREFVFASRSNSPCIMVEFAWTNVEIGLMGGVRPCVEIDDQVWHGLEDRPQQELFLALRNLIGFILGKI